MVRRPLRTLVVIVCLLFFPPATRSLVTAQTPEKLRVAYTVIAPTQANVWVAKELGFYAKYGLDVDLVLLVGAPLAVVGAHGLVAGGVAGEADAQRRRQRVERILAVGVADRLLRRRLPDRGVDFLKEARGAVLRQPSARLAVDADRERPRGSARAAQASRRDAPRAGTPEGRFGARIVRLCGSCSRVRSLVCQGAQGR